ncbi:hypothetical protein P7F88_06840 [Vibrio hannami]|uniref:hypothetical protein n=1 Tax=Vibrio hannami TaxID=2717094 RepID=UPI00240F9923|nr:hypothetical protein [Vibrio hannami]MDG3085825.1 hypothetical protein [Vibrio hannami]
MLEHGTYTKETNGNIVIFTLIGEFNEPGVIACLEMQKKAIESYGDKECFLLVDSTQQTGATPEAYQAVDRFYRDLDYKHLSAIAIVHESYALLRLHERDIPELKRHNSRIFPDRASAILWLESGGK